ncbi:alpha/beta hydrolase [Ectopseudomonas mendocina]|uniref:alpha/beta hydrolase n=1 Tax=Ectopseudomonas mendocina TaxID=300 RepID=UPI0005A7EB30|nr:alpha/beta fold hydrolase [Pseudomonas mendocina]VEE14417.1 alpha/beta fold family hydrolase-like protein [Pseudomonas mendocina]
MLSRETPLFIQGPVGQLEALLLEVPDAQGVALVCHPNPVQGGTMLNKVVSTLQRTARDGGYHTLRFNYRGVGASAGSHDMGTGEVDDTEAVAAWLQEKYPNLPVTLLGFSFGGFVAAALGARLEAQGRVPSKLFMIAPAVHRLTAETPSASQCPLVVIQPDTDEVIEPQAVYDWSANLGRAHELLKVAECGHFFHGKLTDLKDLLLPRL